MPLESRAIEALWKGARRGFAGYPVASVGYYGPDDTAATKVVVTLRHEAGTEIAASEAWLAPGRDLRHDGAIHEQVLGFVRIHGARTVVITPRILGCPHDAGVDFPAGASCPRCPFWADGERREDRQDLRDMRQDDHDRE